MPEGDTSANSDALSSQEQPQPQPTSQFPRPTMQEIGRSLDDTNRVEKRG